MTEETEQNSVINNTTPLKKIQVSNSQYSLSLKTKKYKIKMKKYLKSRKDNFTATNPTFIKHSFKTLSIEIGFGDES